MAPREGDPTNPKAQQSSEQTTPGYNPSDQQQYPQGGPFGQYEAPAQFGDYPAPPQTPGGVTQNTNPPEGTTIDISDNSPSGVTFQATREEVITTRSLSTDQVDPVSKTKEAFDTEYMKSVPALFKYFELFFTLLAFIIVESSDESKLIWCANVTHYIHSLRFFKFVTLSFWFVCIAIFIVHTFSLFSLHWRLQPLATSLNELIVHGIYCFIYLIAASVFAGSNRGYNCASGAFNGACVFGFFTFFTLLGDTLYWARIVLLEKGILMGDPSIHILAMPPVFFRQNSPTANSAPFHNIEAPSAGHSELQPGSKGGYNMSQESFHSTNPVNVSMEQSEKTNN
ncbi:unnamed protein product [Owenia fusiformis]|uniref:Uncharacterized protein n=1 Tax=Owenia fusiformis TaxID=6347 RepID=A0A8J1UPG7_OWEFU|nr:unnamed protein product [Owenia fusiformis]